MFPPPNSLLKKFDETRNRLSFGAIESNFRDPYSTIIHEINFNSSIAEGSFNDTPGDKRSKQECFSYLHPLIISGDKIC